MIRNDSNGVIWQENERKMMDLRERKLMFCVNGENGEMLNETEEENLRTIYITRKHRAIFCNRRADKFQRALNQKQLMGSH